MKHPRLISHILKNQGEPSSNELMGNMKILSQKHIPFFSLLPSHHPMMTSSQAFFPCPSPVIAQVDSVRVEHWCNLEDQVFP